MWKCYRSDWGGGRAGTVGKTLLQLQGAGSGAPARPRLVPSSSARAAVLSTSSFIATLEGSSPADLPRGEAQVPPASTPAHSDPLARIGPGSSPHLLQRQELSRFACDSRWTSELLGAHNWFEKMLDDNRISLWVLLCISSVNISLYLSIHSLLLQAS